MRNVQCEELAACSCTHEGESDSKTDEINDKPYDQPFDHRSSDVSKKVVTPAPVKAVEETCVTCGGAHSWYNCPTTDNNQAIVCATTGTYNQVNPLNRLFQNQASTSGTLPSNTIPNPKGEIKAITTRSGVAYERPSIPTNPSSKKVVERETEETTDKEQSNFQGSTAQIPPPVTPIPILEPDVPKTLPKTTSILESDVLKNLPKQHIPYPSRLNQEKSRDKASNQKEKIFQMFQDLRFDISFADALLLMPRFAPTIKSLLMNKEKLLELAKILLNENCSAMLLKKLPEKLGDPGKFLIPSDPRVPLILGRSFLRTSHALIDVYEGELVLRDGNEQITFHVNDTTKKHVNESIKMVNDTCKDSFKRFTNEPALVCLPPPEDVNNEKEKQEVKNLAEPTAKRQTRITPCLKFFKVICKERIFHSNKKPQVSSVFAITSTLPSIKPKDSLIMGDEHLSTFSAEKIVPILRESEDTSRSNSKNVLPSCEDPRDDSVTLSNPLFEFDVNSSDINPLFDEVLKDIECKDSYDSNLDESTLLVTPLSYSNEDECFDPDGDIDEIEFLLHHDPSTPKIGVASILEGFTDEPPLEENDELFDLESKENEWKNILYDVPIDDLMTEDKVFDPKIWEIIFSPTYVKLPFEDLHYLSLTYVIRIFLPYFTYPVEPPFLLSSGSEDTIFNLGIPVFSLEPVVSHRNGTFMCFNV
ncbi:hypothetical protein Tco_0934419, partial [Tanacetum coccineum]